MYRIKLQAILLYTMPSNYLNSRCKQDRWYHVVVVDWRSVDNAHLLCGDCHVQVHVRPSIGWPICRAWRGREITLKLQMKMEKCIADCDNDLKAHWGRCRQSISIFSFTFMPGNMLSLSGKNLFIATMIRWDLWHNFKK